jgi:hydroxypyruvate reductase
MPLLFRDHRRHANRLIRAALQAANPASGVRRFLHRGPAWLDVGDRRYPATPGRVFLLGAGKAAAAMGAAAAEILGDLLAEGVLIAKGGPVGAAPQPEELPARLRLRLAGHPLSDERGLQATAEALAMVERAGADDLVLCLISGGASALLTQPVIPLAVWQQLVRELLASGCTINELNAVRRVLDPVKGGGVARLAAPAACATLILSDVVGNPLADIGSGPTVPSRADSQAAGSILARYGLAERLPDALWSALATADSPAATAAPDVHHVIVGDVRVAAEAAAAAAAELGFAPQILTTHLQGEAREVGRVAAALAEDAPAEACRILGGETTVSLRGDGHGGRNQEVALAAALALDGRTSVALTCLASDGEDGPTNAAGAIVTGETAGAARALGLNPRAFLDRNDSYTFFQQAGGLLQTGPTGTNVNDLIFIFRYQA